MQINVDQQKLKQLEHERIELLKNFQQTNENRGQLEDELETFKSAAKHVYDHLKIPFESIETFDQIIPILEDRYRMEQVSQVRRSIEEENRFLLFIRLFV